MAFRPEKTDVVVYNQLTNELGVNAPSHALRDLYRTLFGYHFFGCYGQFGGAAKYTLEPLRDHGPRSLQTVDVPGIEHIRLGELQYTVSGIVPALHTVKADDVFACLAGRPGGIHPGWALKKATFRIRFTGQPRARPLTLKPPNVALYTRDSDATVAEQWLLRRAFIQPPDRDHIQRRLPFDTVLKSISSRERRITADERIPAKAPRARSPQIFRLPSGSARAMNSARLFSVEKKRFRWRVPSYHRAMEGFFR